jgi:hypothetical protein
VAKKMTIVAKPKKEKIILSSVKKHAKAAEIYEGMISRAECCVDSRCGCSK